MTDPNDAAPVGAADEPKNPFADFQTEGFKNGEPAETPPVEPAPEAPAAPVEPAPKKEEESEEIAEEKTAREAAGGEKPKKPAAERINELTRKRHEAERRAEAAEARVRELEEAHAPKLEEPAKPAKPGAVPEGERKEPKPEDFEYGELDPAYITAVSRYAAEERWLELETARVQSYEQRAALEAQQKAREKFDTQIKAGEAKYEDFHEKVVIGAENNEWALSKELGELIVESEVGADIAYHLAANPDEAATVYRQTPLEQARYFGRLEAQFSAMQEAATVEPNGKEPAKPKTPQAPAPISPARGAGGPRAPSADTDDFAAFERAAMGVK